jgi:hypothetical protein
MKKLFLLAAVSLIGWIQITAQIIEKTNPVPKYPIKEAPAAEIRGKSNCCLANPFILTPCAQSLIQSFKNLIAGSGVHNCHPTVNYPTVSFAMPENCFSWQTTSASMVTYSSFYIPATAEFRVIWGSVAGNFSYYGACAPSPIIFPHPGTIENHVFGALLIKQTDYRSFTGTRNYSSMASISVPIADIREILSAYVEESGGYAGVNENAAYNNLNSSSGILVNVMLRTGTRVVCHIINNYDGAGTIAWKENNPACVR